jgi:hypothetical protein
VHTQLPFSTALPLPGAEASAFFSNLGITATLEVLLMRWWVGQQALALMASAMFGKCYS